jgi:hypothetical protein
MECENLAACPFFNDKMSEMPVTAAILKRRLCKTDNSKCARYLVAQAVGKNFVPSNLYPHRLELVEEIIAKAREEMRLSSTNKLND